MRPVVRVIGRVLRLVGISSPEHSPVKPGAASDPPSPWRKQDPPPAKLEDLEDGSRSR